MSFWKKVKKFGKKTLQFEHDKLQHLASGLKHDPKRILLGVDPASTKIWNTVLGQHDRPLVNVFGGPTKYDYKSAQDKGIDIGPGKLTNDIAGTVAGIWAGGALGSAAGAGLGSVTGSAVSPAVQTGITAASRLAAAKAGAVDAPVPTGGLAQAAISNVDAPGSALPTTYDNSGTGRQVFYPNDPYTYGQYGPEQNFFQDPNQPPPQQAARGGRAMPSVSPGQARLMRAVAHGWRKPGGGGPPVAVAREFMRADMAKGHATGGLARVAMKGGGQVPSVPTILQPSDPPAAVTSQLPPATTTDHGPPGSITRMLWDRYGIVDPTATPYDAMAGTASTSLPPVASSPGSQLPPPPVASSPPPGSPGAGPGAMPGSPGPYIGGGISSPYSDQLAAHQARIQSILAGIRGKAMGGPVRMQAGGMVPPAAVGGMAPPEMIPQGQSPGFMPPVDPQSGGLAQATAPMSAPPGMGGGLRPMDPRMMMTTDQINQMNDPTRGNPFQAGPARWSGNPNPPPMPSVNMTGDMRQPPMSASGSPVGPASPMPGMMHAGGPGGLVGGPNGVPPSMQGYLQKMRMMQRTGGGRPMNRIGAGDQQGGLARAMQTQTGRPPISRRMAFPGTR